MILLRNLALTAAIIALSACSVAPNPGAADSGGNSPPTEPAARHVLSTTENPSLAYLPDTEMLDREWDVELDYAVRDVEGVYSH